MLRSQPCLNRSSQTSATCPVSTGCGRSRCSASSPTTSNFSWAPGGLLGVGVFFTLSGYLITDILLGQVERGGIRLKSFWLARARRLLPALFVMLIVVVAWATVFGPHQPPDFRWAVASAAAYINNWWLIFHDVSYFAQFEAPGPLNHLWSLSIEEQFYIVWPFLLMIGVEVVHEARSPRRGAAAARGRDPRARVCLGDPDGGPLQARRSTPRGSTTGPTPERSSCWSAPRWPRSGRAGT